MQRLHQNDPTGNRLDRKDTSPVKHICLPAEESAKIRPQRLAKKYINGLLDPIRLNKKVLKEQEAELGQYGYSGQYRQNPVPLGGGMFKTDRLILEEATDLRSFKKLVRYWDKAGTAGGGAYTVGALLGVDRLNNIWILDIVRGQWESNEREQIIQNTAKRDTIKVHIGLEQEPGSGGLESAQATIRRLRGFRVKAFRPTGDKAIRADPFSVEVNSGIVRILRGEWNQKLIDEMTFFPFSTYKDQVDAMSGAFAMIAKPKMILGAGV